MNINATLIGQMLTFIFFVWFCMKLVWPFIVNALAERQQRIADGLAAGERGRQELELAQHKVTEQFRDAKIKSAEIVEKAHRQAAHIIEDAGAAAREEGCRLIKLAKEEITHEISQAKRALRKQVATIAIDGAEKILARQIDEAANQQILDQLIEELR